MKFSYGVRTKSSTSDFRWTTAIVGTLSGQTKTWLRLSATSDKRAKLKLVNTSLAISTYSCSRCSKKTWTKDVKKLSCMRSACYQPTWHTVSSTKKMLSFFYSNLFSQNFHQKMRFCGLGLAGFTLNLEISRWVRIIWSIFLTLFIRTSKTKSSQCV